MSNPDKKRARGGVGSALDATLRGAGAVGRSLMGLHNRPINRRKVGEAAGIEQHELTTLAQKQTVPAVITCIDYGPEKAEFHEVKDVKAFLQQHRPEWCHVRWINVDGLGDPEAIRAFAEKYDLHPLAIEDVMHVPQRPKVETYPAHGETHGRIFIIGRMLKMFGENGATLNSAHAIQDPSHVHLQGEQISLFLGRTTLLSFQEKPDGDIFDPIRTRIKADGSRIRENDASFLMYSLVDALVDNCFPIMEHYSDVLEDLEDQVLARPDKQVIAHIHGVKRELLLLRRAVWPMREVINSLVREHHECLSANTQTYLRDVYDHAVQIIDMVETYREFASGLTETYMSALSNRMNEVMKVLTIMTTIFTPLTFLAGVYGMNFRQNFPELDLPYSYPIFWVVCALVAASMVFWFRWRKWL